MLRKYIFTAVIYSLFIPEVRVLNTDPTYNSNDLSISPQGFLRLPQETQLRNNAELVFALLQESGRLEHSPGKDYFRRLFNEYLRRLADRAEPGQKDLGVSFEALRPGIEELAFQLLSTPPIMGAEYLDAALLLKIYREFEELLQEKLNASQSDFSDFLRQLSPAWRDVGKVAFHLAENKNDGGGKLPFAFMVSFIYHSDGVRAKHLPLAAALKAYAGQAQALENLLRPIIKAAENSALIRDLLESRRIFQPAAWSSQEAYQFLQDLPHYEEANIVVRIVNLWKKKPPRASVQVNLDLKKQGGFGAKALLQFKASLTLDGEQLGEQEIEELLQAQGGLVRIRGQWVAAEPERIAALLQQWRQAEMLAGEAGLSLAEGLRLLAGARGQGRSTLVPEPDDPENCRFQASGELQKLLAELGSPAQIKPPPLPERLQGVLRPYQFDGVKYLWRSSELGLGSCLADDMGLGKTLQLLTLLQIWKKDGLLDKLPALLVLPATLLSNWNSESARFTPELRLLSLHSSAMSKEQWQEFEEGPAAFLSHYDLVLVTYAMLPRLPRLLELEFPAVLADEAQAIKNPGSKQSKAVRGLRAARRIALTGTPVENRLSDLWSIFDFVNPGLLGSLKSFLDYGKRANQDYGALRKLTRPFILRRLKTDKRIISDLPDKTELKVYCHLSKRQAALYQKCVDELEAALRDESQGMKRRGLVLAYLMRFKQICNHPAQFLGNNDYTASAAGKFQRLEEIVESIASRQEKLLLFTQFREVCAPLQDYLRQCFGRPGLLLHGGTPVKERQGLVKAFQEDESLPFFVLSLKAAGTGLNLTAANHVIHFDRWWNPAVENQASDRAYRIGQKRNVLIHKFICKGTLEERIDALISEKQGIAEELLGESGEKLLTEMSNRELLEFIKLDSAQLME